MIFTKNGPVIRDNASSELTSINKDIKLDVERLKAGEYTLTDLAKQSSRVIGQWEGSELSILNGRYGIYAQWGENKKSLSFIKKPFAELTTEDISEHLSKSEKTVILSLIKEIILSNCK